MKKRVIATTLVAAMLIGTAFSASGCSSEGSSDGKTHITMLQYKPEAVKAFEKMEADFNASHDDIVLKIESPNDAMTVLKTRFIKEDAPDIIGIGGDVNFSNFLDAEMLMDISDFEGLSLIKQAYLDIDKNLEFVPMDGVYAVPYVANAAGVLYNTVATVCLRKTSGKSRRHGMNSWTCATRLKPQDSSPYTSVTKTYGPVWRHGTHLPVT